MTPNTFLKLGQNYVPCKYSYLIGGVKKMANNTPYLCFIGRGTEGIITPLTTKKKQQSFCHATKIGLNGGFTLNGPQHVLAVTEKSNIRSLQNTSMVCKHNCMLKV